MELHAPTLLLVNVTVAAVVGVSLALMARTDRHDGLSFWAWAMVFLAVSEVLFGLRGAISDGLSVLVANTLLATMLALSTEGQYAFLRRAPPRWRIWLPVGVMFGGLAWLLPHPVARSLLATLLLIAQCVLLLQLMLASRNQTPGRGQDYVMVAFVLVLLLLMARLGGLALGTADPDQWASVQPVQAVTALFVNLILVVIGIGRVLMSKERADERNQTLAMEDELTGLSNRRAIIRQLAKMRGRARRTKRSLALLLIDADHFKRINDSHGHLSGDQVLRDLAACLRSRVRTQDVVGRWGGEEFMALLPETDAAGALVLAEVLRKQVEKHAFKTAQGHPIQLTISIGVHAISPADEALHEDLFAAADRALYRAKEGGRNRVEAQA